MIPGVSLMALYLAFDPEAAAGIDAIYQFDFSGRGGGTFHVVVRDGDCRINVGPAEEEPNVVYEMEGSTWTAMVQGLVTGDEAVLLGRLRIRGDVVLGRGFDELFKPIGEPPVRAASLTPEQRAANKPFVKRMLSKLNPAA